jgi:phosphopantothenoylcysteine decarboxylase/phosphopantothenate--cysteine ligase
MNYNSTFSGKKILLGITGSIAAYKSILIVRLLVKYGAEVKVVMTEASKEFVSPLVLSTLSKNEVLIDWKNDHMWNNHVELGRWADLILIAPLSCNTLGKMANGICDNLLMAVYLSATCPVMVAPAMDEDMWLHPSTQQNLQRIQSYGNIVMPVGVGELASGLLGPGRMAEPETIVASVSGHFNASNEFAGKKILITAGPTYEAIDPVRFIGNHSTGKMGHAIAEAFAAKGAQVVVVEGPVPNPLNRANIRTIRVTSAEEMYVACIDEFSSADIAILAAAVADFTPSTKALQKIKKDTSDLTLELKRTKDILKTLGTLKKQNQLLVGFALETENEKTNAYSKLKAKNADLIVLNSLNDDGAGFGVDTNKVTILTKNGKEIESPIKTKKDVALDIIEQIKTFMHDSNIA